MNKDDALVSIGMPVHNGMPFIREALESLLCQSHGNLTIVISDDCSTDDTYEVCKSYASRDSRISLILQPVRLGMWDNFQFVFDKSEGDYFMWASQDDIWDQDWIKANLACLSASHISAACSFCTIDESGGRIHAFPDHEFSSVRTLRVLQIMYSHMQGVLMYSLFRRAKLADIAGFGSLKGMGPYIDPLFVFGVGIAGPIARSAGSVMFKRKHNLSEERNIATESIALHIMDVAKYCISYFKLDLPIATKLMLAINTLPLFIFVLCGIARGSAHKRKNM
jgi:glycosyltransferase involved in cell wall biosynthesis